MSEEKNIKLSIIIVNWNVRNLLHKCLKSIFRHALSAPYEIFVVDNNSKDRSREMLMSAFHSEIEEGLIKVIFNDKNLGFAKANNQAILQSKGEYVLLLNPDTEIIEDNTFEKSIEKLEKNERAGIFGCELLNLNRTNQPSVRRFPTLSSQAIILLKLHHFLPLKTLENYFALDFDYDYEQTCDQVMGAYFLVKRKLFDEIGFLDENFWIWFEEVDFCKRAKDKGYEILYSPDVKIVHFASQSFKQMLNPRKQKEFNKSLKLYFKKHKPTWQYYIICLLHPLSIGLSYIVLLVGKFFSKQNNS